MYHRGNQFDAKLNDEFGRLEQAINLPVDAVRLDNRGAVVLKPRVGNVVYADGTNWNPGIGAGPYYYTGSKWVPISVSGTYTPTLTNTTNVAASTAYQCFYTRSGDLITVSGKVSIDPTATTATALGISLPVASALTSDAQLAGTGSTGVQTAAINADAANDRANFLFTATDITNQAWFFSFTYRVI
jgi:hypothetical protein